MYLNPRTYTNDILQDIFATPILTLKQNETCNRCNKPISLPLERVDGRCLTPPSYKVSSSNNNDTITIKQEKYCLNGLVLCNNCFNTEVLAQRWIRVS